jgi:hypothetical protein
VDRLIGRQGEMGDGEDGLRKENPDKKMREKRRENARQTFSGSQRHGFCPRG